MTRSPAKLSADDETLINEAYYLHKNRADNVWPGWTNLRIPIVYIKDDYEYAIGFPKSIAGFQMRDSAFSDNVTVQTRKRILQPNLAASFDYEGINAVVIGTPTNTQLSPNKWVLTVLHEMFHVYQNTRGENEKVAKLGIAHADDTQWELNYAFPYADPAILRLTHLQGYLIYLGVSSKDPSDAIYDLSTALEAMEQYRLGLLQVDPTGDTYKYYQLQEWKEGIARYTEYRLAQLAADPSYVCTESFRKLKGANSYAEMWKVEYESQLFPLKHAGRGVRGRTMFYYLGLGKGLLLDRLMPGWKAHYFDEGVWIDTLLQRASQGQN